MYSPAVSVAHVYKKFRRGEHHDSLRDLLPALTRRTLKRMAGQSTLRTEEFWALHDISFEIGRGEAVGIIGQNGAGKSTILKLLSGILKPTAGRIDVAGRLSALIEVGAGFHQDLTGRENVYLNGVILGMSRAEVRRKFDEIVEFSGLEAFIDTPVKRYSSGMYARLGFSVAAHLEPDVLIVDEVLSVGDYVFQAKSIDRMRSVVRGGATVLFVSHNLRAVADLCGRAILLDKGLLVADGPSSAVIHKYMDLARSSRGDCSQKPVFVESVHVAARDGARFDFLAGEHATVAVTARANRPTERVACILYLLDENFYRVFYASSERLGGASRDLGSGDTTTFQFGLDLNLGPGNYQLCVALYRHDIDLDYDVLEPAATLLLNSPHNVIGPVNLYPTLSQY